MSVSLALIPVALTLRMVMGSANFGKWVTSREVRVPSIFRDAKELMHTLHKAGYDGEVWGGSIKTHVNGKELFAFWELVDGKWTAIFDRSDSRQQIDRFMADINRAAGGQVLGETAVEHAQSRMQPEEAPQAATFPTNFRDGELLFRTLKEFGVNPARQGAHIVCKVENSVLTFVQAGEGPFYVEIKNAPDLHKIYEYLTHIDDDYKRCLQTIVYERLKERAAAQNMTVESEEVLEDNSIVVTLNLRG
ncbi:hypothetical protein EBB07_02170 [Paenibacillaceae bacterium]|nr:hypothetical protein EBB07_02170 [Paenibacillaceae bacterium]